MVFLGAHLLAVTVANDLAWQRFGARAPAAQLPFRGLLLLSAVSGVALRFGP
ncbi:MAG: hypothetical protein ACRDZO_17935 [Egibacteraceae bacterium]